MRLTGTRRRWRLLAGWASLLALPGCGIASAVTAPAATNCKPTFSDADGWTCPGLGTKVYVTVKNFAIRLPAVIPTGKVSFIVHGVGPTLHEFNVARSSLRPDQLPLADDDTVDDSQNTAQFFWVGQVEGIDVGVTRTFTTEITPGHYVFYCNMDGHYMAGMSAEAVAR